MLYYFQLQYLRNLRRITDFGIQPLLAVLLVFAFFIGSSFYIFTLEYHQYIYTVLAIVSLVNIHRIQSSFLIKQVYNQWKAFAIRTTECVLMALPFVCFLSYFQYYYYALFVLGTSVVMALFPKAKSLQIVIPTPFSQKPFEFSVGFRKSILLFVIHAFLLYKAVEVNNLNLGLFTLLLTFFTTSSFFFRPENQFFVWIFNKTPSQFLRYKIFMAVGYYQILLLPTAFILLYFFPNSILFVLGFCLISLPYLIAIILAKYAAYPNEIQLPQLIFLGISLLIPPFLIITIYRFYQQSIHNLNSILAHDKH